MTSAKDSQSRQQQEEHIDAQCYSYVEEVNPNLICCICQTPFIDPVVSPCGHTFCETCIYQSLDIIPSCPIDRVSLALSDLRPAVKIISNMVNELLVYCPRRDQGCLVSCQRQLINYHLKEECEFACFPCGQKECYELVLRKDMSAHVENCRFKVIECFMCKSKIRLGDLETHNEQCPASTIQCPYCSTSHSRSQSDSHLSICPDQPISCPHSSFGCPWFDKRFLLNDHIEKCTYEAIKGFLTLQQGRYDALERDVRSITRVQQDLRAEVAALREDVNRVQDSLADVFPSHFSSDPESFDPNDRIHTEIDTVRGELLELKQNVALMTETLRMQEEIKSLRAVCHGLRTQMHFILMERRGQANASVRQEDGNGIAVSNTVGQPTIIRRANDFARQDIKL